jgi:hypothetical protein
VGRADYPPKKISLSFRFFDAILVIFLYLNISAGNFLSSKKNFGKAVRIKKN